MAVEVITQEVAVKVAWLPLLPLLGILTSLVLIAFTLLKYKERRWLWLFINIGITLILWKLLILDSISTTSLLNNDTIYVVVTHVTKVSQEALDLFHLDLVLLFAHLWFTFMFWLYDLLKASKESLEKKKDKITETYIWLKK